MATNFAGDLTVSSSGVISASNLDDDRVYDLTVQVTQGTSTYSETFSVITGTNAGDTVGGTPALGDDVIFARGQGDIILAGSGNDTVFGQAAADQINGGSGNDTLYGGGGNDTFTYATTSDSQTGTSAGNVPNYDAIMDFSPNTNTTVNSGVHTNANGDIIDLTAIDAIIAGPNPNDAFTWVGTGVFTAAGQLHYTTTGTETIITGNTDANTATVEFEIHLLGVMTLDENAFNL